MTTTTFDEAREAVAAGQPPEQVARALVAALTIEERLWCLDGDAPTWAGLKYLYSGGYHKAPFVAAQVDRVGLPGIRFSDGPRGAVVGNATAFPVPMARGATWDPELEERIGEAIGLELRAIGANLTGAVCVNVLRHPAWGRSQETYGEDPHHVGELGAALTRGLQRHVMACVKHFACNSMENARFSVDIAVDEVALHEVYLPQFKRIVDEGVASVMSAYNSVNGEWAGESPRLLKEILREEWGFGGVVISDWIFGLRDAATSLAAGLDVEMPYRMIRAQHLTEALASGAITNADVDRAVENTVATLLRFDHVLSSPAPAADVLGRPEHRELAREVAARSVVLLRNETIDGTPLLPLPASIGRLAVVGRLADTINLGDGGSSDVWDLDCDTILAGLQRTAEDVVHDDGSDPARSASLASAADVAVVVVGYTFVDEGEFIGETDASLFRLFPTADEPDVVAQFEEWIDAQPHTITPLRLSGRPAGFSAGGDRITLRLLPHDVDLIRAVAAANPRTIVVIQAGSAVVMTEWIDAVPAVVQGWYAGCRAGAGLADVLFGRVNPSARLPFSIPADESDLPAFDRDATSFTYDRWLGWWHLRRTVARPAYPFGFGLSYTTFELANSSVEVDDDRLRVSGVLRNSGRRDGADVVQVYAELPDPEAPNRLIGFTRVEIAGGSDAAFQLEIPLERLRTRDPHLHQWLAPSGLHRISVARNADDQHATTHDLTL